MKKFLSTCAVVLTFAGCAGPPLQRGYSGEATVVIIPELNSEANAEIGQTIISKANVTKIPAIVVLRNVSEVFALLTTIKIQAGTLPLFATNASGKFYRDANATYTMNALLIPTVRSAHAAGIYVPDDKSQPAVIADFPELIRSYGNTPVTDIKQTTIEKWGVDSFKRELVYSGVSQNTISILYREFSDNMARPAFSQELKYDLSLGKEIGFKGARFEIVKASNTGITYKVLKALD